MKIIETTQKLQTVSEIKDIICNKCGNSCRFGPLNYEGLIEVTFQSGFYSTIFGDCQEHSFSLCEPCLKELYETFKHSPLIDDYDDDLPRLS